MTTQAKSGDTVRVHYIGTLDSGDRFDSSVGSDPLEFTLGSGQVITGFEEAVTGMTIGETKKVRIPSEEAYGPRREEMLLAIAQDVLPEDTAFEVGQQVQMRSSDGQVFNAIVADVAENEVTFDANHPLAGEALTFDLQLMEIMEG